MDQQLPLLDACSAGDLDRVKGVINDSSSSLKACDVQGNTVYHVCCYSPDCGTNVFEYIVNSTPSDVSVGRLHNNDGSIPLHLACAAGKKEFVQFLLSQYNTVDDLVLPNHHSETPLHFASKGGHLDIVLMICSTVSDISPDYIYQCIKVASNWPIIAALLKAITFADFLTRAIAEEAVSSLDKEIFRDDEEIEWKDVTSLPLHRAADLGNMAYVQYLIDTVGCDINRLNNQAFTALHRAILCGHESVALYLISLTESNCQTKSSDCGQYPLHHATRLTQTEIVRSLIDKECDINVRDDNQSTPLHIACSNGCLAIVELLVSKPQCLLEAVDSDGKVALHYAVCKGYKDVIVLLRDKISSDGLYHCIRSAGADNAPISMINLLLGKVGCCSFLKRAFEEDKPSLKITSSIIIDSNEPLHAAVRLNCLDAVQYLVQSGVFDINSTTGRYGDTLLHIACGAGNLDIVKFLANHPQCNSLETGNKFQIRPLHEACRLEKGFDVVRYLVLEKKCDVNVKDYSGRTPLHFACMHLNTFDIVELLANQSQCTSVDTPDNGGRTPLAYAAFSAGSSGNLAVTKYLAIQKGCNVVLPDSYRNTLLHQACRMASLELVEFLIKHPQCDIEAENNIEYRPIHIACKFAGAEVVSCLVNQGQCDINAKAMSDNTPLHMACETGNLDAVKIISNHPRCTTIDAKNYFGERPLHLACKSSKNVDVVCHLVTEKNSDINGSTSDGKTPFYLACRSGCAKIMTFLLDHPKCTTATTAANKEDTIPLHWACKAKNVAIVRKLVMDKRSDVNVKGWRGYTPLHFACSKGSFEIVKILADHPQCNTTEAENDDGNRPIHEACAAGNVDIVRYLVDKKGCNIHAEGKEGTPLFIANKKKRNGILAYLSSKYELKEFQTISRRSPRLAPYVKYQKALTTNGMAILRHSKCIITGSSKSGKTTLLRRLLDDEPATGSSTIATISQVESFKQYSDGVGCTVKWTLQDVNDEAVMILENIAAGTSSPKKRQSARLSKVPTPKMSSSSRRQGNTQASNKTKEITGGRKGNVEDPGRDENKGLFSLSTLVGSVPVQTRKQSEKKYATSNDGDSHIICQVIDTGGLAEHLELLPALVTGPYLHLQVFNLTEDLRSHSEVSSQPCAVSTDKSIPRITSFTHEEVMMRSLASISCSRHNTNGWHFDKPPIEDNSTSAACIIATHRDGITKQKMTRINKQLKEKLDSNAHQLGTSVVFPESRSNKVFFALDLTNKDENEINELRSSVHEALLEKFSQITIPASWCAFSLNMKKKKQNFLSYNTCYKLAQECGIETEDDFKSVLWFLHNKLGTIRYYPEVEEFEGIIITNLKMLFDHIEKVVATCDVNGYLTQSNLEGVSATQKSNPFTSKRLVSLLRYLHILAGPIADGNDPKTEGHYFLPCSLKPVTVSDYQHQSGSPAAHLLITFDCGYTPVGIFCGLVAYLVNQSLRGGGHWKLANGRNYRNMITFEVGTLCDSVTLISHASYLEVSVGTSSHHLPESLVSSLHHGLLTVTQSLHYTNGASHKFAFFCCSCSDTSSHPAIIDDDSSTATCIVSNSVMSLNSSHLVWIDQISQISELQKNRKRGSLKRRATNESSEPSCSKKAKVQHFEEARVSSLRRSTRLQSHTPVSSFHAREDKGPASGRSYKRKGEKSGNEPKRKKVF